MFYLYAVALELLGVDVMPVRLLVAGARVASGLLLYSLARRGMPWQFAVLPPFLVAAVDPVPITTEPHPAWWALLATLLTLEAILRHSATWRLRWIALAGAAAAVTFCFKQNAGAFAALAVGGYVLLRPRERAGWLLATVQILFAVAVGLATAWLLWPALGSLVAAALWLPLLATLVLLVCRAWGYSRPAGGAAGFGAVVAECTVAGAAFVGVTLLWLVPLTVALGPDGTPFGLFVGVAVNQGALNLPLELLPRATRELALVAIWAPLGLAMLFREPSGPRARRLAAMGLGASCLVPWIPIPTEPAESLVEDPNFYPWLTALDAALGTLYPYLPALGAWAALVTLALSIKRGASTGSIPWYLLVGTLSALTMYPRPDLLHAMFAGPPLLVAGAWALHSAHRALTGRAGWPGQVAMLAALLVVPVASVAPHLSWRYVAVIHADPRSPTPPPYVPLGLARAPVQVPRHVADSVRGAVEHVRAGTSPGDPFFVYPAIPMMYFLADRANPTRFNHLLAGALTDADMAEVLVTLDVARPRYVLWDHAQVVSWRTDPANRPLSDYIWRCYEPVANYSPFVLLERRGC